MTGEEDGGETSGGGRESESGGGRIDFVAVGTAETVDWHGAESGHGDDAAEAEVVSV